MRFLGVLEKMKDGLSLSLLFFFCFRNTMGEESFKGLVFVYT